MARANLSLSLKLEEFDKSRNLGWLFEQSKAIQAALHMFIDGNDWKAGERNQSGTGAMVLMYDNYYLHSG